MLSKFFLARPVFAWIIAHRLNTIENADDIFFVNGGTITEAGDMRHAVDMLLHDKRQS
jgi:ATP-binding cassette subfamily B protein